MTRQDPKAHVDPQTLAQPELAAIVEKVRDLMCLTEGTRGRLYLDPEKEINGGDCVDGMLDILRAHNLVPQRKTAAGLKTPKATALVCPHCGYDGKATAKSAPWHTFRIIEDLSAQWKVVECKGRVIRASDDRQLIDESYTNTRIECANCLKEFAVPKGMTVRWD